MMASGLAIVILTLILGSGGFSSIMLLFFLMGLLALYHDYRPLVFGAIISLIIINYVYFTIDLLESDDIIAVHVVFIIFSVVLIAQSIIGEKMRNDMNERRLEAEHSHQQTIEILHKMNHATETLHHVNETIQEEIQKTRNISNDITISFRTIADGMNQQASSVGDVNDSLHTIGDTIHQVAENSVTIRQVSKGTLEATKSGDKGVQNLSTKMEKINDSIETNVETMATLTDHTNKVTDILSVIHDIADQTNLLALNASIEAARAGEHGKGFAVVSDEIRKLATNSQLAANNIANILSEIKNITETALVQIKDGQNIFLEGNAEAKGLATALAKIMNNTISLNTLTNENETMNTKLNESAAHLISKTNTVSTVTEETATSVAKVLTSVEEQHRHIDVMVHSLDELNKLINDLKEM